MDNVWIKGGNHWTILQFWKIQDYLQLQIKIVIKKVIYYNILIIDAIHNLSLS